MTAEPPAPAVGAFLTYIFAIAPAHDEAGMVGPTVRALIATPGITRVIVVDDGSTDSTAQEAADAGAEVIRSGANLGKGGAVRMGLAAISGEAAFEGSIVLFIDSDVGDSASEAHRLLAPVLAGEADMTIGVFPRRKDGKGGFGIVRSFASWSILRLGGSRVFEPLSGQRAVRAGLIGDIHFDDGYGMETGMTIDALRAGARIVEIPVEMSHARTGRDLAGFLHRGRQLLAIVSAVLRRAFSRSHPRP